MKDLTLIVWLTQLGLSVAAPLAVLVWLGVWLRDSLGWGDWAFWICLVLGIYCALDGFWTSLQAMNRMSKQKKNEPPPVAFNDHE